MACANPAITTDEIGLDGVMGDAGIFVPPRDPRSLADATLRLLSDSALRAKLGQHARSIVDRKHSWKVVAEAITELFQELIQLEEEWDVRS